MQRDGSDPAPADPATGTRRELPDDVLVARAAAGDPRSFEQLVRRHQQQMYGVALRITGRPGDAEDATQNAFLSAWRRLPEFRGDAAFSTWMYRIVSNHALNQVRARGRSDRQVELGDLTDDAQPVASDADPADRAEASELARHTRAALDQLPVELRVCWLAREVDHCSYQEVADIAGISLDTARGRIYRARLRLAAALQEWR